MGRFHVDPNRDLRRCLTAPSHSYDIQVRLGDMTEIGVIADSHNLIRPEAMAYLQGSELIIHAGDIGSPEIIAALKQIAPVIAIRGNIDKGSWADAYPSTETVEVESRRIYVLHDLHELRIDPSQAGFDVVISGHSHKPQIRRDAGVLYVNPGSAGPRRFTLPISVAKLSLTTNFVDARLLKVHRGEPTPRNRP